MRGYFGIGCEGISKQMNFGAIMRTANAFGASFCFTVNAHERIARPLSDTAKSKNSVPYYAWQEWAEVILPEKCQIVGVELTEDAIELPSFRHPSQVAYIFGPERGTLSEEAQALCHHIVKIPTKFCVNVSIAAALIMYDRQLLLGQHKPRPVHWGG